MDGIDPKDAATIVDITVEDLFAGPGKAQRQAVVVRLQRHLQRRVDVLESEGHRVRLQDVVRVERPRHRMACEFVVFASEYSRYEADRITARVGAWFRARQPVRVTTVRALMHSVRLPAVKETTEFEELLPCT